MMATVTENARTGSGTTSSRDVQAGASQRASAGRERGLKVWAARLAEETGDGKILGDQAVVDRWAAAVSRWLVDAALSGDVTNLHAALEELRAAVLRLRPTGPVARLEAAVVTLAEVARASLDRARQVHLADTLDPGSWAARMLVLIFQTPHITSADMVEQLGVHEAQISRSGKALVERGLVVKSRHGRAKGWHATPRGTAIAQRLVERSTSN
jgi:hypothetical protein